VPTQAAIRQRMLQIEPSLGRTVAIAALAARTIEVDALKTGVVADSKFLDTWLLRPDCATAADRVRICSAFNSGTGVLEHEGADYADTTVGTEQLELHEHEPYHLDDAIQEGLRSTRFRYRHLFPARSDGRYHLHDLDWITEPAHIVRVGARGSRVLTPNRHLEQWNGYSSAGALVPDWYTLAGAGATFARSTTQAFRGRYALQVTRAGTDATVTLTVDLNETGVSADSLRGEQVTGVLITSGDGASSTATVTVDDGVTPTVSDPSTSAQTRQELMAVHTIDDAATTLQVIGTVTADGDQFLDELYLVFGALDDTIRRDVEAPIWRDDWSWFQQGQPLVMHARQGRGSQLVVDSRRPYEQFDAARVLSGDADGDESDCPLDLAAYAALWRFFENRISAGDSTSVEQVAAAKYRGSFARMQSNHFYEPDAAGGVTEQVLGTRRPGYMARIR